MKRTQNQGKFLTPKLNHDDIVAWCRDVYNYFSTEGYYLPAFKEKYDAYQWLSDMFEERIEGVKSDCVTSPSGTSYIIEPQHWIEVMKSFGLSKIFVLPPQDKERYILGLVSAYTSSNSYMVENHMEETLKRCLSKVTAESEFFVLNCDKPAESKHAERFKVF